MIRVHVRLVLMGFAILALAATASAQTRTRLVAATGQTAPGGGIFTPDLNSIGEKGLPSIAGNTIVFGSEVFLNGQTVYGVFVESNTVLRAVTRVGAPAPGGGTILAIESYAADRLGNVFLLVDTDGGGPDALLRYSFGFLSVAARIGDVLPGDRAITGFGVSVAADGYGGAYVPVTFGDQGSALARWRSTDVLSVVAATTDPAPNGGTFGAISPATLTSSTSGLVAFTATVNGGQGGLFTGLEGNLFLADPATDVLQNLTLSDNDDADVAFMRPGQGEIRVVTIDGVSTAVANGISAPRSVGRINFADFKPGMAADSEGSLYFFAPITGDSSRGVGLFLRDRFTGQLSSVVLQGDTAPTDIGGVYGLFAIPANRPARIANDDGKVVFAASAGPDYATIGVFTTLGAPEGLVPTVSGVSIKKNKLNVTGASFETGARILVNGTPLADTKNNKKAPTTKLQSKSGGGLIAPGATVSISVQNPRGGTSSPFSYTRPR
jgi:hypothetical protein